MPWRFEERTRLVPRHGLSWRHLKASTQSTNKTRWNSAAIPSQPPHNKQILHLSHPLQFTLSALTRNACAVSFNRGRSKADKIPPNSRNQEPKARLSLHLVLLFRGNSGSIKSLRTTPLRPMLSGWSPCVEPRCCGVL